MRCRRLSLSEITLLVLAFAGGCSLFVGCTQTRGAVLEKWQTENKTFQVRVTSYEEKDANVNGAAYRFESSLSGSNDWHEIVTFRHDDQPKIPTDQVRFVNDQIGYLFMGWIYAVTIDGGASWSVWDANHDLPNWRCCNYKLIADVTVGKDGSGVMRLNPIQNRYGEVQELHTNDYGRHWQAE
ncbi:MAG TPA: hypothetical protein VN956_26865 [Pyrinomonadaceae bacterium]|nr:hypothetical protein [Pyrinomonadaceae bacterium]